MDILCPVCCEPWEIDTLHEYVSEASEMFPSEAITFDSVYRQFKRQGCGAAFGGWKVSCERDTSGRGYVLSELADILGDDIDGYASFCDDFGGVL